MIFDDVRTDPVHNTPSDKNIPAYSEHLENKGVLLFCSHGVPPLSRAAGARKFWGPEVSDKNTPAYSEHLRNKGGGIVKEGPESEFNIWAKITRISLIWRSKSTEI